MASMCVLKILQLPASLPIGKTSSAINAIRWQRLILPDSRRASAATVVEGVITPLKPAEEK
jgi:hypothetical protein